MSSICPNCQAKLGCGCQLRRASNGAQVCANCIVSYENNLNAQRQQNAQTPQNNGVPLIESIKLIV